jgi:anion-transporting  ArsA/GET3 family ATPase
MREYVVFLKRFRPLAVIESAQSATELIVTDQAPTTSTRRVMGLKNTMAFLVEREKPWWSATNGLSS